MANLIQTWRERWGYWRLSRQKALSTSRTRFAPSLPPKSALILFDASLPASVSAMETLLTLWEKKNMTVFVLGYYPDKSDHPEARFSYFNQKAVNFHGDPQGEVIERVTSQPVDVLIRITSMPILPLDWIAVRVPAAIKIASAPSIACFTLQLDGHHTDLKSMILQADRILDTLKKNAHVIA